MSGEASRGRREDAASEDARYRRIRRLARGGMGEVELVVRERGSFERLYALKRLRPELREDVGLVAMFFDEARLAGLIHHPNVVSALDVGVDDEGPFLVMDYIDGVTVRELLGAAAERRVVLPVQLCSRIAQQVASGLHAAHELRGRDGEPLHLVHRDVSPQNILLGFDGVVRVTDFGVARALGRRSETTSGILKGKTGYMAPEQLRFQQPDRRTDLFTLGVVLFEMLAGRRLYGGPDRDDSARRILEQPAPDLYEMRADAHPALVELLFELLAKDPDERPSTAEEVARRLGALATELAALEGEITIAAYLREEFPEFEERAAALRQEATRVEAPYGSDVTPPRRTGLRSKVALGLLALAGGVPLAWMAATSGTAAPSSASAVHGPADPAQPAREAAARPTHAGDATQAEPDTIRDAAAEGATDANPRRANAAETGDPSAKPESNEARPRRPQRMMRRQRNQAQRRPKPRTEEPFRAIDHAVDFE